jgi:hypothetical protein
LHGSPKTKDRPPRRPVLFSARLRALFPRLFPDDRYDAREKRKGGDAGADIHLGNPNRF